MNQTFLRLSECGTSKKNVILNFSFSNWEEESILYIINFKYVCVAQHAILQKLKANKKCVSTESDNEGNLKLCLFALRCSYILQLFAIEKPTKIKIKCCTVNMRTNIYKDRRCVYGKIIRHRGTSIKRVK